MKSLQLLTVTFLIVITACDKEQVGPETNCTTRVLYDLNYHFVTAAKVYDIKKSPPLEIRNGTLEYDLFYQWQQLTQNGANPWPYNHYYVYSSFFNDHNKAMIHFTNVDIYDYDVFRNDCQIEFYRPGDTLHAELVKGGFEIAFDRYAIYDHSIASDGTDTFTFIEFRNELFKSYKEIIAEFAKDNTGSYDTIAIELVSSRTKE